MANTIQDGTTKQVWMPNLQRHLDKALVSIALSEVYRGPDRVIHNPYQSTPSGSDGTAQTTYTIKDFTVTDDNLTVNRRAVAAEHVDNIEALQSNYKLAFERAKRHAYTIKNKIDQFMLNLPVGFSGVQAIDDGDFAGTAGNPYQLTNANVDDVNGLVAEYILRNSGATEKGMFWVVSPQDANLISQFKQTNGFSVADAAIRNGLLGDLKVGSFDVYFSNNLTHKVVLTVDTNPSDGDTITFGNGPQSVTFTFRATPSAAGDVDIAAAVDDTRDNLIAAITAGAGAGTDYIALSFADQEIMDEMQLTGTDDDANDQTTFTAKSTLVVSETFTAGTNVFGDVGHYTIAGIYDSMFLALPADGMTFEKKKVSGKHGEELESSQIYNGTIWNNMQDEIFTVYLKK